MKKYCDLLSSVHDGTWGEIMISALWAILFILLTSTLAASAAPSYDELAKQVLAEINLARRNPRGYADYLRTFRGQFHGRSYRLRGSRAMVGTVEGVGGVDEAIRFLRRQKPLPPLVRSEGLSEAAGELAREEGESGAMGHMGESSGSPRDRIERHGRWRGAIGEDIFYGSGDARQVVMNLIIDDGVPDRGHRKNIFSKAFRRGGAACGPHPGFETVCVIDFAGEFRE